MSYHDYSAGVKRGVDSYGNKAEHVYNPGKVDEGKWEEAKKAAEKSGYHDKWALVTSIYKKMGGTFHKKD